MLPTIRLAVKIGLLLLIVSAVTSAYGKEQAGGIPNDASQEEQVQPPNESKQPVDIFTIAVCFMSVGCMLFTSSVHWNHHQRKQINAEIIQIDDFLAKACSVEYSVSGFRDSEPMVATVQKLRESRDAKLKQHEDQRKALMKKLSETESEIMRIWA
jgi:hypothetical protein